MLYKLQNDCILMEWQNADKLVATPGVGHKGASQLTNYVFRCNVLVLLLCVVDSLSAAVARVPWLDFFFKAAIAMQ